MNSSTVEVQAIRDALIAYLPTLKDRYKVRALWLFGSYARGEAHRHSDIDLLVDFEELPSLVEWSRLQRELSRLLGRRVEIVPCHLLKPFIRQHIMNEVISI